MREDGLRAEVPLLSSQGFYTRGPWSVRRCGCHRNESPRSSSTSQTDGDQFRFGILRDVNIAFSYPRRRHRQDVRSSLQHACTMHTTLSEHAIDAQRHRGTQLSRTHPILDTDSRHAREWWWNGGGDWAVLHDQLEVIIKVPTQMIPSGLNLRNSRYLGFLAPPMRKIPGAINSLYALAAPTATWYVS